MVELFDSHCHLNDRRLYRNLDTVLSQAKAAGVDRIVCPGYDLPSSRLAVEIADRYTNVWATVGIHPHDAKTVAYETLAELTELASAPKVVAIGEIGLDYYRDLSPRPVQQEAFRQQLRLANTLRLPVVIHDRDAGTDIRKILEEEGPPTAGGVLHCFSEDLSFAEWAIGFGFCIGLAGPVTWTKSDKLREVARKAPLDKILIETDAPHLTPHPFRGRKDNEPAFVRYVAEAIAELKGMSVEEIAAATADNAGQLFRLS